MVLRITGAAALAVAGCIGTRKPGGIQQADRLVAVPPVDVVERIPSLDFEWAAHHAGIEGLFIGLIFEQPRQLLVVDLAGSAVGVQERRGAGELV